MAMHYGSSTGMGDTCYFTMDGYGNIKMSNSKNKKVEEPLIEEFDKYRFNINGELILQENKETLKKEEL